MPRVPPGLMVTRLSETASQAGCVSQTAAKEHEIPPPPVWAAWSCSRTYWVKDSFWPSGSVSQIFQPMLMSIH